MSRIKIITDPEAIKALSDRLRITILQVMQCHQAISATALAEELGESASKISYHLKQLEKHGIVQLAETRAKGNLLEHFYAPTAEQFMIQRDLSVPNKEEFCEAVAQTVREINALITADLLRLPYVKESLNFPSNVLYGTYYLTREEIEELQQVMHSRLKTYADRKPGPGLFACNIGFQMIDIESLQEGPHEE